VDLTSTRVEPAGPCPAYRHGYLLERRQRLMSDWAAFCLAGEDAASSAGNVVAGT
jgi:hypothetical protein